MKKLIVLLLEAVMCISLVACGSSNPTLSQSAGSGATEEVASASESINSAPTEFEAPELKDLVVGKWVYQPGPLTDFYMELYKGGSGTQFDENGDRRFSLTWKIEDDVINISMGNSTSFTGYVLEDDTLTSVDGQQVFKKEASS